MADNDDHRTEAAVRRSRWPGWIWAVPIAALGVVVWLGVDHLLSQGPDITIAFATADGLKKGSTEIRYKGMKVGTLDEVRLSDDDTHVVGTFAMQGTVEDLLREGTRFWVIGTDVGITELSKLKTIISGAYVRMSPGPGEPARHFDALENPPATPPEGPGTRYVLAADSLGAIEAGASVRYLGLKVGSVQTIALNEVAQGFNIGIWVRAPYDGLVQQRSRFWSAGAVRLTAAGGGFEASLPAPGALLSGMVAFETPPAGGGAVTAGHRFTLFADRAAADAAPTGPSARYVLRFDGSVGALEKGAPVTLRGFTVGRVAEVRLDYDPARQRLQSPVIVEIAADRIGLGTGEGGTGEGGTPKAEFSDAMRALVESGLRARLERSPPLIGAYHVALGIDPSAPPATLAGDGGLPAIPTEGSTDIRGLTTAARGALADIRQMDLPAIGRNVQQAARRAEEILASQELSRSLDNLDAALSNVREVTESAEDKVGPAIESLHQAANAAEDAVAAANRVLGGAAGPADRELPNALEEIAGAARAVRVLARYLSRNPEALIQGRD